MSETQILEPSQIESDIKMDNPKVEGNAANAVAIPVIDVDEADLEDGEIDDDEDDVTNDCQTTSNTANTEQKTKCEHDTIAQIDLLDDSAEATSPSSQPIKSKKPKPVEDDHASRIELALASALKKKGIDPVVPKVFETRNGQDEQQASQQSGSRSSRRRKRKKQREEKEKAKEHREKKSRYDSPEPTTIAKSIEIDDEDEIDDDYEMLNVRGGSPPPMPAAPLPLAATYNDQYESADDSSYSYDSYDSTNDVDSPSESRRRRRNKKDKESRKRRDRGRRNRDDDKRRRRGDSPEEKRQEPRKLELCKFYLMECCAKRDKCSYMHGDFPCKYYYLGMDCALKDDCKFSHGEPLSEQLRNILLKHLETAPKEILGNFKRISREQAIAQMVKRHEELCKKFGVDNTWGTFSCVAMSHNRRGGSGNSGGLNDLQLQQQQQNQLQHHQQQQHQHQQSQMHSNIPSLLDMVIKPPVDDIMDLGGNGGGNIGGGMNSPLHEKQRKSRWNENSIGDNGGSFNNRLALEPPPNNAPSYLDLKNLTGILSDEHIDQLSQMGIVNLEQVNQLTVGQLNRIGLTINEINDIQLNAKNMAKLGVHVVGSPSIPHATAATISNVDALKTSPKTEVSSNISNNSETTSEDTRVPALLSQEPEKSEILCTNSNSNSSTGVVMVDYSQYLKDSNLPYDRCDDDERDDEQLIIDDGNVENDDTPYGTPTKSATDTKKRKDSLSDSESQHLKLPSIPRLQISDFSSALRNPFSTLNASKKSRADPRLDLYAHSDKGADTFKSSREELPERDKNTKGNDVDSDDERYYASRGRRSRSVTPTRSGGSSTPEASQSPKPDEFGAPPKPRAQPKYERGTMYDFDIDRAAAEDEAHAAKTMQSDKDMRFIKGGNTGAGDVDLRLPFLPVTNYTPATEIDASITSHLPMTYKVYEVDVKTPCYVELRQNFKSDQTGDPRLRRILGLPETSQTRTAVALSRSVRKLSNSIASPESSDGASPKYYTPSMSSTSVVEERSNRGRVVDIISNTTLSSASISSSGLRLDPRRAARQAAEAAAASATPGATSAASVTLNNANKQNVEIRNYLQKSEWYKNLNSKFKIMVNQQLALVSTELKKFHQDPSPSKIFDISFIVNNNTLQQILTNLGIYIDDNGEVAHVDGDTDDSEQCSQDGNAAGNMNITSGSSGGNIMLPNLSQPPPTQQQQQMDFLRGPPPNMLRQFGQFCGPPPNTRPSLLGLPPVATAGVPQRNPFNPFAGPMPPFAGGPNVAALLGPSGPSLLGPGPVANPNRSMGIGNFNVPTNLPQQQQQRNFGNQQQRNQRQRRNNFSNGGAVGANK